jgi:hypothetical protein
MNLNLRIKEIDSHLTEIRKKTERVDLTILEALEKEVDTLTFLNSFPLPKNIVLLHLI